MNKSLPKSRKWMLSFLIVFLMVFTTFIGMAGSAQYENRPESENNDEVSTGSIIGVVFDIETNPIAGAIVYLASGDDNTNTVKIELKAETNERGYFEFTELPRGLYLLKVYMEGYKDCHRELKLPSGETIKVEIKLELLEQEEDEEETEPVFGTIVGHVYNALDNEPIAGAIIIIYSMENDRELKLETNERGMFEVKLPRGKYVIVVEARGFWPYKEELIVKGNDDQKIRIPMRPREPEEPPERPSLCGHIFDAVTDKPIFGWVELSSGSPEIPAPNKNKDILYEDMDYKTRRVENEEPKESEEEYKEEFNEPEYGSVIGYVFNALDNEPIVGALVKIYPSENDRELKLETNERGIFEVKLPRGKYVIVVEARGFWPYKEELIVKGNDDQKLRIPLKPREPEEPPERPERPEKPEDYKLWRTFTNRDGWYEYFDVKPGHYDIRAFAHGHIMFYNEIDIEENSHIYLDIYLLRDPCPPKPEPKPEPKPVPMSVIGGHVYNARTKDPVAGAVVCAIPIKLIKDKIDDLDLKELGIDIDWNNIQFNQDIEVEFKEITDEDIDPNMNGQDPGVPPEQPPKPKTRQSNDEPETEQEPVREFDKDKRVFKFCTKTNDDGNFKLKIPSGAYVLLVKARGYYLFAHKFFIKPNQHMWVRIPLKPIPNDDNYKNDENNTTPQRPLKEVNTPRDIDRPKPGNINNESESETASVGSSVPLSTATAGSALTAALGILILIAAILGFMVWRKHNIGTSIKPGENKVLKK